MKVSVIIPTYNYAHYITEAVESVLNQTYKDFEIIVVDDGSTDNTKEVIRPYLNKIKYIYQQNSGPSAARNRGIKEAKGEYIAFLDADDIWLPQKLELQIKFIEKEKELGLVFSDMTCFNEKGILKKSFLKDIPVFNDLCIESLSSIEKIISDDVFNALLQGNFIPTNTVIVKKECFDKVGLFDENLLFVEDRDMWLRIALAYRIGFIKLPLVKRRFHRRNINKGEIYRLGRLLVMQKYATYPYLSKKSKKIIKYNIYSLKCNLGCSYFSQKKFKEAHLNFKYTLKENPFHIKSWLYYFLTLLPKSLLIKVKNVKKKK